MFTKILVMKTENMESDIFYEHILKKLDEGKSLKNEKNYNYFNLNLKLLTSNDIYNNTLSELINIFKFNKTKIQFLKLKLIINEENNLFEPIDKYFINNRIENDSNTTQKIKINDIYLFKQIIPKSIHSSEDSEYLYIVFSKKNKEAYFVFKENACIETKLSSFKSTLLFLFCLSPKFHIIHGSSLSFNNKGILIIGPAGSGKTTVSIDLIKKGSAIISDNISYIKSGSLMSYFILSPPKLNLGYKTASYFDIQTDFFKEKKLFTLQEIEKNIQIANNIKIDFLIVPVLGNKYSEEKISITELLANYEEDFLKPEIVYLFTKLKLYYYFKIKTMLFWKRKLKNKVILKITLDKNDMTSSLKQLTEFLYNN